MATEPDETATGERTYRAVFERSPDAMLLLDADAGVVVDANAAASDLFGASREQLREQRLGDLHPDGRDLVQRVTGTGSVEAAWQIERADGGTAQVEVTLSRAADETGQLVAYLRTRTDQRQAAQTPAHKQHVETVVGVATDVTEGRVRERRLEENEAILAQLTETTDDVFWLFDADFSEVLFVNGAYEEVWGRSLDDLRNDAMDFLEGIHPEDREIGSEAVERLRNGEPTDLEYRVNPAEDFQRWVSVRGTPVFGEDGEVERVAGFARDITERKKREQNLRELQGRLDLAVEGAGIGTWDWDIQTDEVVFNDAWAAMLGYTREELDFSFDTWELLVHPDDFESSTAELEAHVAGETDFYEHEIRMQTKAGDWKWVRTIGRVVERDDGEPIRAAGIHLDIDDRKQAELDLRESERQFEAVFNDPHALVGLLDTDGTIRRINETALESVGADSGAMVGTPFEGTPWWSHDEDLQADVREWLDRAADGEYVEFEAEHPLPDDGLMAVEGTFRPVMDDEGGVTSLVASARDITERRERKNQLEKSNERLEQFAYIASHDLQEPLRTVSNYTEMIAEDYGDDLPEEAEELVDIVVTGSERMQSMIDGLLDFSRVTTRGEEFKSVDTGQAVADVAADLSVLLDEHDGSLEWADLPTLEADGDQFRQVVQNLVKNALEHSEGPVNIDIRATDSGDEYRFEVADDGPGIEHNRQDKIFRIFKSGTQYQTSSQAKGIGLAICDNIADRHGGDIWVESDPGEGATFVFTIDSGADDSGTADD